MRSDSIQARLAGRIEDAPGGKALCFYRPGEEPAWLTRAELYRLAASQAGTLANEGVGAGDRVVMVYPSEEEAAVSLLAALWLGAVPLLIAPPVLQGPNSSLRPILEGIVERTRPRLVMADRSLEGDADQLRSHHAGTRFVFGHIAGADSAPELFVPASAAVAAMQLTSGTTGFPRVCVWRQEAVMAAIDGMAEAMGVSPTDTYLNWTPLYHDMGLVNNFLLCLTLGIPLVMLSPHDFVKRPAVWLQALSATGATTTWSPNFGFALAAQRVRDDQLDGVRLDRVRGFWNAAERIHLDTMRAFQERFEPFGVRPEALKTNFGCAENIGGATFSDLDGTFVFEYVDAVALQEERVATVVDPASERSMAVVGVGRPHPRMNAAILDERGEPLPDGMVGEIGLDTPSAMVGYLGDEQATAAARRNGYLLTGDLGYRRDREVFWVGRVQERINVRGRKVDPSDFEAALLAVPALRPGSFAAFGVDDPASGTQRVVLVAELREGRPETPDEVIDAVRDEVVGRLGLAVSEVVLVQPGTLTKTSSGKRRHRHFRRLYLAGELPGLVGERR